MTYFFHQLTGKVIDSRGKYFMCGKHVSHLSLDQARVNPLHVKLRAIYLQVIIQ